MNRFEIHAAYILGVALPLLEVLRRRSDFTSIPAYADDFIAGGVLLFAARAVSLGQPRGRLYLIGAWGILCGGIYSSFFTQLEALGSNDISGLPGLAVVVVKGIIFAVAVLSLALSIRSAGRSISDG